MFEEPFFWHVTPRHCLICSRRFEATYWSQLQGCSAQEDICMFNLLKKRPPYYLETSGTDCAVARRRESEEGNRQLIRRPRTTNLPIIPRGTGTIILAALECTGRCVLLFVCLVRMRYVQSASLCWCPTLQVDSRAIKSYRL
jgi:hypothetical protein